MAVAVGMGVIVTMMVAAVIVLMAVTMVVPGVVMPGVVMPGVVMTVVLGAARLVAAVMRVSGVGRAGATATWGDRVLSVVHLRPPRLPTARYQRPAGEDSAGPGQTGWQDAAA